MSERQKTYKVIFTKRFEIWVEAPSSEALREVFNWGGLKEDLDGSNWETGEWEMVTGQVTGKLLKTQKADHFLDEDGVIRNIDDREAP